MLPKSRSVIRFQRTNTALRDLAPPDLMDATVVGTVGSLAVSIQSHNILIKKLYWWAQQDSNLRLPPCEDST